MSVRRSIFNHIQDKGIRNKERKGKRWVLWAMLVLGGELSLPSQQTLCPVCVTLPIKHFFEELAGARGRAINRTWARDSKNGWRNWSLLTGNADWYICSWWAGRIGWCRRSWVRLPRGKVCHSVGTTTLELVCILREYNKHRSYL